MNFIALTTLSSVALALAGCGQKATPVADAGNNTVAADAGNEMIVTTPAASPGQTFANAAASSDAFEIETSKLALTSSTSTAIKSYAQKMIDAHNASTIKLKAAAASASPVITPDPALTSEQQAKLDALKSASGKAFDHAYIAAQTEGHQKALDTLRAYGSTGDVAALKTFATGLAPIVAAHLNMAKGLKA